MTHKLEETKEKIIQSAQRLFAERSFHYITMIDIATAAQISRRTLYTHFKNKEEIYNHIVDQKLEMIHQKLKKAQTTNLPADKRMKLYIKERFKLIGELMCTNQFIKKTFLTHNDKIETLRKHIDQKELELLTDILKDGVKNGIFAIGSPKTFAGYLHPIFKSLEFSFIRRYDLQPPSQIINEYIHILFYGIIKK